MSTRGREGNDPSKKHRHDIGSPDHGPERTAAVTRTIQVLLGTGIILTAALLIYAMLVTGLRLTGR